MAKHFVALAALAALPVVLANDPYAALNQAPLLQGLDVLEDGLMQHLPYTSFTYDQWGDGWIPQECKSFVQGGCGAGLNFNPADMITYNVHYSDCGDAWVFCMHKDSGIDLNTMAGLFGRLPIQMRQWVRHVMTVPGDNGWAFNCDGTITFIRPVPDMLTAVIHETGHSLDLQGAYNDKPLSSSDNWFNNLNQDSYVPDPYSQSNSVEDVAQNTVVAVFNENYPGGFGSVIGNSSLIFEQYATVITEAREAGEGNSIIVPGENQQCSHRLANSAPVSTSGSAKLRRGMGAMPDVKFYSGVTVHEPKKASSLDCKLSW